MRRALNLEAINEICRRRLLTIGAAYLGKVRAADDATRALSLPTYEDGGLKSISLDFARSALGWPVASGV